MARRVELDLPDNDGPAETPRGEAAEPAVGTAPAPPGRLSLLFRFRFLLLGVLARFKRPDAPLDWRVLLNWKVLAAGFTAVLLVSAAAGSFVYVRQQESERIASEQGTPAAAAAPAVREAVFPDFSIDIKDGKGRYRFLQCDVTVEFREAVDLTEERRVEIRKAIYLAGRRGGAEWIGSPDSAVRFKKGVREELGALLGEGALKEIYVTRYVLI